MGKIRPQVLLSDFFSSLYKSIRFSYHCHREHKLYGDYEFPYRDEMIGNKAFVLANGPSLSMEINALKNDEEFNKGIKFVLNFFASSELYSQVKPQYYCVADPIFFIEESNDFGKKMVHAINENTDWDIKLFVPYYGYNHLKKVLTNPHITIIPISSLIFEGFSSRKYLSYKKGLGVPSFVNVTIMIEYILLNLGCKDIRLYGVDHTFFEGLTVNDDNIPCIIDNHFYGKEFIPVYNSQGGYFTTAGFLMDKYLTFKEHENMRGYADYLGAQIVNCTKGSLIDAYIRLSQLEKADNL